MFRSYYFSRLSFRLRRNFRLGLRFRYGLGTGRTSDSLHWRRFRWQWLRRYEFRWSGLRRRSFLAVASSPALHWLPFSQLSLQLMGGRGFI